MKPMTKQSLTAIVLLVMLAFASSRNGGNITVNITEHVDDEIKAMPAISDVIQIGTTLPNIKDCYFYCKGTGKRMRDLARWPMQNGSILGFLYRLSQ